ncbi:hypothetical protein B0H12DRAFT_1170582 [Mycena haematopus]|nr:hypothetical protein B0H12DRAFT_1170582 [Mycena haematopus]
MPLLHKPNSPRVTPMATIWTRLPTANGFLLWITNCLFWIAVSALRSSSICSRYSHDADHTCR